MSTEIDLSEIDAAIMAEDWCQVAGAYCLHVATIPSVTLRFARMQSKAPTRSARALAGIWR